MGRVDPAGRRRVAVAVAVVVHGALGAALLLQPRPERATEPPVFSVQLLRPPRPETPRPLAERGASTPAPSPSVQPRRAVAPSAVGPLTAGDSAPPARADAPLRPPPGLDPAIRNSLAQRLDCREPIPPAMRERCAQRLVDAPEMRLAEMNPYALTADHMAVMAGVRHGENATRASCDAMRNLDNTCINLLPDNLLKDSERKRGAPPPPR